MYSLSVHDRSPLLWGLITVTFVPRDEDAQNVCAGEQKVVIDCGVMGSSACAIPQANVRIKRQEVRFIWSFAIDCVDDPDKIFFRRPRVHICAHDVILEAREGA